MRNSCDVYPSKLSHNSIRKSGTKCNSWNYLFAKKNDNNYMPLIISSMWSLCSNDNTYIRHQASLLSWTAKKGLWGLTAEKSGEKGCKTYIWKILSKTPKTELFCYLQNDAQINATREPDQEIFLRFCSKIGKFLPRPSPWGLLVVRHHISYFASFIFRLVPPNQSGWLRGLLFGTRRSQIFIQGWWYWFQFYTT